MPKTFNGQSSAKRLVRTYSKFQSAEEAYSAVTERHENGEAGRLRVIGRQVVLAVRNFELYLDTSAFKVDALMAGHGAVFDNPIGLACQIAEHPKRHESQT